MWENSQGMTPVSNYDAGRFTLIFAPGIERVFRFNSGF